MKNRHAKTYQCARRLAAPFKLAITGTPMENNLMELWSLLSITAPGLFPDPTKFADFYAKPIEKTGDAELLALFRRRIKPLVKRRTKERVAAELPAKQEQVLDIELPPRHRALYNKRLQRERQKVLGLLGDMQRNRFTILKSLTVLRQMALHPGLVDPAHDTLASAKIDALAEQLARRRRRRPPRARVQPVHPIPRPGPRSPRHRGNRLLLSRWANPQPRHSRYSGSRKETHRFS